MRGGSDSVGFFFYWLTKGPWNAVSSANSSGGQACPSQAQDPGLAIDQSQENGETISPDSSIPLQDHPMSADPEDATVVRVERAFRDFTARFGAGYTIVTNFYSSGGTRTTNTTTGQSSPSLGRRPEQCVCLLCVHQYLSVHLNSRRFDELVYQSAYAPCPSWARPEPGRTEEVHSWLLLNNGRFRSWAWVNSSFRVDEKDYRCPEHHCHSKFKDVRGVLRHYQAKHCTEPSRYPCSVFNCKYSGNNGFLRKDKLKSHYQKVHAGQTVASNTNRRLLPTPSNTTSPGTSHGSSNADTLEEC